MKIFCSFIALGFIQLLTPLSAQDYCTPIHVSCCNEYIQSVSLCGIDNDSGAPTSPQLDGYSDFTHLAAELRAGNQYLANVAPNYSWPQSNFYAWIDFNGNKVFEASEQIASINDQGPYAFTFKVPEDAVLGETRMRVRLQFGLNGTGDPCAGSGATNGETEDYTIMIEAANPDGEDNFLSITDKWNRPIDTLYLVDWEGYMANPAIELNFTASECSFVELTVAGAPRVYFDMPSIAGPNGPTRQLTFDEQGKGKAYISIFPDRDAASENYELLVKNSGEEIRLPIKVIDQDIENAVSEFNVHFDYSQDTIYNFLDEPRRREIVEQAGNDIAYFLEDMNFDEVPAQQQDTWIWSDSLSSAFLVKNDNPFKGYLMYVYGIHREEHKSGGGASNTAFQTINGIQTPLMRSGGYLLEIHGNFDTLGWNLTYTSDTWYEALNLEGTNDLYSVALHEMEHALGFHTVYPKFIEFNDKGFIDDPEVVAYYGAPVPLEKDGGHMNNSDTNGPPIFDPFTLYGVMGSDFAERVPRGRFLMTKLNLLVLKAVGYQLRETSAFIPVSLDHVVLSNGSTTSIYTDYISASGGVPIYQYEIIAGNLPEGLALNAVTGEIAGIPKESGIFNFTVRVEEYEGGMDTQEYEITIEEGVCQSFELMPIVSQISCAGETDASISLENTYNAYSWSTGSNFPSIENLGSGSYLVTVKDEFDCSATTEIIIDPAPLPIEITLEVQGDSILASVSGGTGAYQFLWNDPAGQTTATAIGLVPGEYTLSVTDENGCLAAATAMVSPATSIENTQNQPLILFPNPAENTIQINHLDGQGYIYSIEGKCMMEVDLKEVIDVSGLKAGMYFVRSKNTSAKILKFVKMD